MTVFTIIVLVLAIVAIVAGYLKPEVMPLTSLVGFILLLFFVIRPLLN